MSSRINFQQGEKGKLDLSFSKSCLKHGRHFVKYKKGLRFYKRWPCSTYVSTDLTDWIVMRSASFVSHKNHVSASPTNGNGPTQGQRRNLTRCKF